MVFGPVLESSRPPSVCIGSLHGGTEAWVSFSGVWVMLPGGEILPTHA
jgi:hypothetical protein